MVNIEQDMQSISSGLWRHQFDQIARSAENIANHARIKPSEVKKIRAILGQDEFKAFVQNDKTVRKMASKLNEAAKKRTSRKRPIITGNFSRDAFPAT